MSRTPLAMRTLIRQVQSLRNSVETEASDLDGLGVLRKVAFDKDTSEWLAPLAEVFGTDERIADHYIRDDRLFVVFVPDIRADRAQPDFVLAGIDAVLNDDPEQAENASLIERREERRKELQATAVADLRERYGYDEESKKPDIIVEILAAEGFGTS